MCTTLLYEVVFISYNKVNKSACAQEIFSYIFYLFLF